MGRVGVDLYPEQSGVPLAEVRVVREVPRWQRHERGRRRRPIRAPGGRDHEGRRRRLRRLRAPGAARLRGRRPIRRHTIRTLRTPIVFCELLPPESPSILFYREPRAPGHARLRARGARPRGDRRHAGSSGRRARAVGRAQPNGDAWPLSRRATGRSITVHDLDYRADVLAVARGSGRAATRGPGARDDRVGNVEECAVAVGDGEPDDARGPAARTSISTWRS